MAIGQFHQNAAGRHYIRRFVPLMTIYVLVLLLARHLVDLWHPVGAKLIMLSVAPAVPLVGIVWAMGMYLIEERDEYLRDRLIRSILIATGFMLAVTTVWGFLEEGGLARHVPAYSAFIVWCVGLGFAQAFYSWRDILARRGS